MSVPDTAASSAGSASSPDQPTHPARKKTRSRVKRPSLSSPGAPSRKPAPAARPVLTPALMPAPVPQASAAAAPALRVLHVCAELYPLLKTGGLADVTGALPLALVRQGCEARVLLPGFPAVLDALQSPSEVARLRVPWTTHWGEPAEVRLLYANAALPADGTQVLRLGLYVIEAPFLYQRPGNPYADGQQHPYADNHRRFALLN